MIIIFLLFVSLFVKDTTSLYLLVVIMVFLSSVVEENQAAKNAENEQETNP
jgi:hypothetical protein